MSRHDELRASKSPEELAKAARDGDHTIRSIVAHNAYTSPETLMMMTLQETNPNVLWMVSFNEHTPPQALKLLAYSDDCSIRGGVATNPSTPPSILSKLSIDSDIEVRRRVANNRSTSARTLTNLAEDNNIHVLYAVAHNPNTPEPVRFMLMLEHTVWTEGR